MPNPIRGSFKVWATGLGFGYGKSIHGYNEESTPAVVYARARSRADSAALSPAILDIAGHMSCPGGD